LSVNAQTRSFGRRKLRMRLLELSKWMLAVLSPNSQSLRRIPS